MLRELTVQNFAVIERVEAEFTGGFTVFSGETGAGKSVLIGAISFVLGGKAEETLLRDKTKDAIVEAVFDNVSENVELSQKLSSLGINAEDDEIIIRRVLKTTGKTSARISGVKVKRSDLQFISQSLLDIHGQHDNQSLLVPSEHRRFLDSLLKIEGEVASFSSLYQQILAKNKELVALRDDKKNQTALFEMYDYAVKEIEAADIKAGEEASLETELKRLSSYESLCENANAIQSDLGGEAGSTARLRAAMKAAIQSKSADDFFMKISERLEAAFYEVEDIEKEVSRYVSSLSFDQERLNFVENRLSSLHDMEKKYVPKEENEEALLRFLAETKKKLFEITSADEREEELSSEIKRLTDKAAALSEAISAKRCAGAADFSGKVSGILSKLGMKNAAFLSKVTPREGENFLEKNNAYGADNVEFLLKTSGEFFPLSKIASGGELSRVMLALKSVLAKVDSVPTLIFDEIDTGVGGEVAVEIARQIKELSDFKQIFCITHLASIAVFAENHFKSEKITNENNAESRVCEISGEERVREIARMLSGEESAEALKHARAMLLRAEEEAAFYKNGNGGKNGS